MNILVNAVLQSVGSGSDTHYSIEDSLQLFPAGEVQLVGDLFDFQIRLHE